tara:strand:- start:454 stop:618 length:165 start_codon:yes stop_codon:yes gene_type:complete
MIKKNKQNSFILKKLIKEYPKIISGRKNFDFYDKRIKKNISLIKKFKLNNLTNE